MRLSGNTVLSHRHLVLLALVLALGACGGGGGDPDATDEAAAEVSTEAPMEEAPDAAAYGEGDSAEEVADAPAVATVVPDWFPDDVYLPETYSVPGAMDVGSVQRAELRVAGTVADLTEQARAGMREHGWTEANYLPPGDGTGATLHYTKGERSAMLSVNERGDGDTRIGYQFTTF